MSSNYSVYGSAYKTSIPVKYPKLSIKINNISKIDPNTPIIFTLPKKTNLIFNDDFDLIGRAILRTTAAVSSELP